LPPVKWARLYRDFYPQIRSWFVTKVASEQDADDLAEQVFAELGRGDTPDNPKAYIATVAANALSRYRRRKAKERTVLRRLLMQAMSGHDGQHPHELEEPSDDEESSAKRGEMMEEVLSGLPPTQAELLKLRFVAGLRVAQVARRVGCSRDAAYKRLQRIIKRLRERYDVGADRPSHEKK
jgi:RNA polymerase sigma-70 factor (ECF subfamily)